MNDKDSVMYWKLQATVATDALSELDTAISVALEKMLQNSKDYGKKIEEALRKIEGAAS